MIAGCPKCSARYRVDLERIGEAGAKLRCTKCSAVFLVRAPRPAPPDLADSMLGPIPGMGSIPSSDPPAVASNAVASAEGTRSKNEPTALREESVMVLIADPNEERGKRIMSAIESWGATSALVQDGVEAIMAIQRLLPKLVVLDAALPKMFGFQVCEVVKRNESLRHIDVVLIGAIHHQERYRRSPADFYGADVYLEQPDLPDGLLPLLRDAGLPVRDRASQTRSTPDSLEVKDSLEAKDALEVKDSPQVEDHSQAVGPPPHEESVPAGRSMERSEPVLERVAAAGIEENSEHAAERERAERLARIAVSEMLLYQPEKFDQAIRDGNIEAVLDLEIGEARALIRQRISEEVRAEKDFILVELERVAKERGGTS